MHHKIATGAILIKDGALLPKEMRFESEPCVLGWAVVTDIDRRGLDREIQKIGWTFFSLAGEVKATVFGIDRQKMLRRAIERILARGTHDRFNSLEITQVTSTGSERFPLVHYATVSDQWRHIQQSLIPDRAEDTPKPRAAENDIHRQGTELTSGGTLRRLVA